MDQEKLSPTTEQKAMMALEEFALVRYYRGKNHRRRPSASEICHFLFQAQRDPGIIPPQREKGDPERNVRNYRAQLRKVGVQLAFDLKEKAGNELGKRPEKILHVADWYLRRLTLSYDRSSLERIIRVFAPTDEILPLFVCLRYILKFQLRFDFTYKKLMKRETTFRRTQPLFLSFRGGALSLVAVDEKDGMIKQFLLAGIRDLEYDLLDHYQRYLETLQARADRGNNLPSPRTGEPEETYYKTEAGHFYRKPVTYRLRVLGHSLERLRLFYDFDFEMEREIGPTEHIITLTDSDSQAVFRLICDFTGWIELLGPPEMIQDFQQRLAGVSRALGRET